MWICLKRTREGVEFDNIDAPLTPLDVGYELLSDPKPAGKLDLSNAPFSSERSNLPRNRGVRLGEHRLGHGGRSGQSSPVGYTALAHT